MGQDRLRQTFLQKALDFTLGESLKFNGGERAVFAAALFLTGDALGNGASVYHVLKQTAHMLENRKLMVLMFHLINGIDDIVDEMTAHERMAAGSSHEGSTPCEFLRNEDVCIPAYHQVIERIAKQGLLSYEEEISFSNLYAVLIQEGAMADLDYSASPTPQNRQNISELNLKLAEVVGVHVLQHCVQNEAITEKAKLSGLSYDDIIQNFPRAAHLCRMSEYIDDMRDIFVDLEREAETNIPSPNVILTKLYENGKGYNADGGLGLEMQSFLKAHRKDRAVIHFDNYPECLKEAVQDVGDEYFEEAYKMNPLHRDFMITWWRATADNGICSSFHPDVVEKKTRQADRVDSAEMVLRTAYE